MTTLRELREVRGFSQPRMARELGVSEKTIRNWERGETKKFMVHAYCSALEMRFEDVEVVTLGILSEQLVLPLDRPERPRGFVTALGVATGLTDLLAG